MPTSTGRGEPGGDTPRRADGRHAIRPGGGFTPMPVGAIDRTIATAIEAQVAAGPERIAVKVGDASLSYGTLERAANRLAHALAAVIPDDGRTPMVALAAGQSLELVVGIVGILKAGAAYVPIDPTHPVERTQDVLRAIHVAAVVAESEFEAWAAGLGAAVPILVPSADDAGPVSGPTRRDDPDRPAYVYFTSGSTGRPKGVVDTHRNVLHNVRRYTNSLAIGPDDRLSLVQGSTFSGAVSSLFGALVNGATSFPFDVRRSGAAALGPWVAAERLTMFHAVPVLFRALCTRDARYPDVRVVRLEGDAAAWSDAEAFQRHFSPGAILVNGLGTTETGLVRQFVVDHATPIGQGGLPLGYPVPDMSVAIVDVDTGAPVPPGTVGEIEVTSRFLALGYWDDARRTAAAFRPVASGSGAAGDDRRAYRTGDLGRLGQDDLLVGLGRRGQVDRIHGETVDPPEIERLLRLEPGVRDAVVTTRRDGRHGAARLIAYVVPDGDPPPASDVLRRSLGRRLSRASVPSVVVMLPALSLDASAKVDRARLPAPPTDRPSLSTPYAPPASDLEAELVGIWESVLGVTPVGIDDDFFDLGGDSLDAARLAVELADLRGRAVADDVIARSATVRELAASLDDVDGSGDATAAATWFAIHVDRGNTGYFGRVGRSLDRSVRLVTLGPDQDDGPDIDIEARATAYVDEIRRRAPDGPYHLAGSCMGAVLALEVAHRLQAAGQRVAIVAMLGIGPLDFPALIQPGTPAGRAHRSRAWLRRRVVQARARGDATAEARYVIDGTRRALGHGWGRIAGRIRGRERPSDRSQADLDAVGRAAAIAAYDARPFEGRVVVVLGRDSAASYTQRPGATWRGLGDVVSVILTPGIDGDMLVDPGAHRLAEILTSLASETTTEGAGSTTA
jgi:amino acid adenylation domain-containing protein